MRGAFLWAFHSFEKAYEIFSEQKDFYGFFLQTKGFLPKAYEIFWSEMPLDLMHYGNLAN